MITEKYFTEVISLNKHKINSNIYEIIYDDNLSYVLPVFNKIDFFSKKGTIVIKIILD